MKGIFSSLSKIKPQRGLIFQKEGKKCGIAPFFTSIAMLG